MDTAFEAFCAAGLWPALGRTTAGRLPAAHINGPDDVTEDALAEVDGVSRKRAKTAGQDVRGRRAPAGGRRLLYAANLPVRPAFGAVEMLGRERRADLLEDPWRLLDVPGVEVSEADRFAIATLEERPTKDDPRRGRALDDLGAVAGRPRRPHGRGRGHPGRRPRRHRRPRSGGGGRGGARRRRVVGVRPAYAEDGTQLSELLGWLRYAVAEEHGRRGAGPAGCDRDAAGQRRRRHRRRSPAGSTRRSARRSSRSRPSTA